MTLSFGGEEPQADEQPGSDLIVERRGPFFDRDGRQVWWNDLIDGEWIDGIYRFAGVANWELPVKLPDGRDAHLRGSVEFHIEGATTLREAFDLFDEAAAPHRKEAMDKAYDEFKKKTTPQVQLAPPGVDPKRILGVNGRPHN